MFYVFQTKPTLLEAAETKSVLNTKPLDIPTRSGDSVYKLGALRDYSTEESLLTSQYLRSTEYWPAGTFLYDIVHVVDWLLRHTDTVKHCIPVVPT